MRVRTAAVLAVLVLALGAVGGYAAFQSGSGGSLTELWVSDTARNNTVNHHAVGADGGVVVAPVAALPGAEEISEYSCSLVRLDPADGGVRWRAPVDPDRCFLHAITEPAITDVDGDGHREVAAGTTEDAVRVLAARDGSELARVPTDTYGYARPTVADLSGDGQPELLVSDIKGGVVVAEGDGTVRWRANVSGSVWTSPIVGDVTSGDRRVLVVSNAETVAFGADGSVVWRRDVTGRDAVAVPTDDGLDLLLADTDGLARIDGETGEREWFRATSGRPRIAAIADGDGDGTREVYAGIPGHAVAAFAVDDGSELWRTRLAPEENAVTPAPIPGDLTGDGDLELAAVTADGTVVVLDPTDGAELAAYERAVPVWTPVTLADLTDDPGREILVRYGDGRVVALSFGS